MLAVAARAEDSLAERLRKFDGRSVPAEQARGLDQMLAKQIRARIHNAHRQQADEWEKVRTLADWQRFRDARVTALRRSLGTVPPAPSEIKVRVAGILDGDGYRIERLVFEGRPGLPITANLYLPAKPPKTMPGLLVLHSFFHGKHQGELKDLGVNGARAGCAVLVPDLLGHGERRQHPFVDAQSYPERFNVPRQDYTMRSLLGLQLDVAGESLMGWFVFDVMRGVDVLLKRPDIDREKIVVLGAVAAGGDVAAVAAALDPRIRGVVSYNFGGPEPETPYPLPAEGELSFPYASGGHWDSTRRLRHSARDGSLPWVVVGAVAPRAVVYAHEFAWDREHDPAWKRLTRIYELHDAAPRLGAAFGKGTLFGKPEGTGCGNIGAFHRRTLAPFLKDRFGIIWPEKEIEQRRGEEELRCLTPVLRKEFKPRPVHELAGDIADAHLKAARAKLATMKPEQRTKHLRATWETILNTGTPSADPKRLHHADSKIGDVIVERSVLEVERGIVVPLLLLRPSKAARCPVVIGVSQHGKQQFLAARADDIAALLEAGIAVCLPDVRGTGETTATGDKRGRPAGTLVEMRRTSEGVLLANEVEMLGGTLVGERLRDLRSVMRYLRGRMDLDGKRLALWGVSLASVNRPGSLVVPFDAAKYPQQAEPLGGLLALLAALYENVEAVHISGGLLSYRSLLQSSWLHVPADAIVPGVLTVSDLSDVEESLPPRILFAGHRVDGLNIAIADPREVNASRWFIGLLRRR